MVPDNSFSTFCLRHTILQALMASYDRSVLGTPEHLDDHSV